MTSLKLIFIIVLCTSSLFLFAQAKYSAASIPAGLIQNADAVIRTHKLIFEVANKGEATEIEHTVITLLNEHAASLSEPAFYYDEFEEIMDIEASVYDAEGELVRNLKKKDIEDRKPLEYFVNDTRYKILHLPGRAYPYTIEYSVQKKHNGLLFYPAFQPQISPAVAVEYASFEVKSATGLKVRFKENNLPEGTKTGNQKWELKNIPAFKPAPFASTESMKFAQILSAPTAFNFGGIEGDMSTWESFGIFLNKLNETQQELPNEVRSKLAVLVEDCPDDFCKIQRIYGYLQENTRYFFIGLGIGGWQPAPALQVDKYKYGDCKGLSNYTVSMLNAVGIPARYTLIRAGDDEQNAQFPDFPNAWFNHAIVCIPMEKDTVWLECTSQSESCGFLSDFTDNRMALVMTPTGGKILHTPVYDETKNLIQRKTEIQLFPDGSAELSTNNLYEGIPQIKLAYLEGRHDEERRKDLYKSLNINDFEILSYELQRHKERVPSVAENLKLHLPKLASINGKRLFFSLCILSNKVKAPIEEAFNQAYFQPDDRGFTEMDSIEITLPEGFKLETPLIPISIDSKFGQFHEQLKIGDGKLFIERKLVLNSIQRSKEEFAEFTKFLKAISRADKLKIVLVKDSIGP